MIFASLLTPAGRGAVAVVRIRGSLDLLSFDPPLLTMIRGTPVVELPVGSVLLGHWGAAPGEDVVVCRVADDELEVCCHGGPAASARILLDVEVRRDASASGKVFTLTVPRGVDRECLEALSRATTLRTADILLQQQSGLLRRTFEQLEILATTKVESATQHVHELLRWAEFGRHLTHPWQVVLCGRPNVGKSSLANALLGYSRSIVFDQPGTTRDIVTAETALEGWPIEFSDTAGFREADDDLERAGVAVAQQRIRSADLQVLVLDGSVPLHQDDWRLRSEWPGALVVRHKSDLQSGWDDHTLLEAVPVSSLTGAGVNELASAIVERLAPEIPASMTPIPVTSRQTALLQRIRSLLQARGETDEDVVRSLVAELVEG